MFVQAVPDQVAANTVHRLIAGAAAAVACRWNHCDPETIRQHRHTGHNKKLVVYTFTKIHSLNVPHSHYHSFSLRTLSDCFVSFSELSN